MNKSSLQLNTSTAPAYWLCLSGVRVPGIGLDTPGVVKVTLTVNEGVSAALPKADGLSDAPNLF